MKRKTKKIPASLRRGLKEAKQRKFAKVDPYLSGIARKRVLETREAAILDMVDTEMRPIVEDLRKGGLETFTSCQSGPGHSFSRPIVRINKKHTKDEIFKVLKAANYKGYHLSAEFCNVTEECRFWHLEFYVKVPKRGVHLTFGEWYPTDEITRLKHRLYYMNHDLEVILGVGGD